MRSLAEQAGISDSSVLRIWQAHGLKPHRVETFKVSRDPKFVEKLEDIVGLYLSPPDLVDRNFSAQWPDQLWVADITYVPTLAGFLFLAVVLDVCTRRIVGWAMANHLRTELILDALNMALWQRRPRKVIHHSDQGCQAGVRPSMGSVGDCFDNA